MREGYRQIGKPTFDLRQALDRLLRSHRASDDGGANFCALPTFQRCPVKVRNFWGQLPQNIPVGNVWQISQTKSQTRNGKWKMQQFHKKRDLRPRRCVTFLSRRFVEVLLEDFSTMGYCFLY